MSRVASNRGGVVGVVVIAAVLFFAFPALAHHTDLDDPRDTMGPLDLVRVEFGHSDKNGTWTLVSAKAWSVRRLWDHGYVVIEIDSVDGPSPDYQVVIRSNGNRMVATLFRNRTSGPGREIGPVHAWKPDARTVSARVDLDDIGIGPHRLVYRWDVVTVSDVCDEWCIDRAPDEGLVDQPVPGVTPSPTVTPTPTTSPSA